MANVKDLYEKRAKAWEAAKAFLDSKDAVLSAEDTTTYERMEKEINDLTDAIGRQERLDKFEAQLKAPVSDPITAKPGKMGRAEDSYKKAFWDMIRYKVSNEAHISPASEGGYLVPDEFEKTLIQALQEECFVRNYAHVINTSSGTHEIPVVSAHAAASWIDEDGIYNDTTETFGQESLAAYKEGTLVKVSEELLNDSAFDVEAYFRDEFARRLGVLEEEAFLTGNGTKKPTGMFGTASAGVTAANADKVTADEVLDLYYSLKAPYRKNAIFVMQDASVKAIRKLKDTTGQYLWQPGLRDGEPDLLLGRPLVTSEYAPEMATGNKSILFGDLSYYWIGDRAGVTFRRLDERYAEYGQVGFLGSKRVDGKLVLAEACKVLTQA